MLRYIFTSLLVLLTFALPLAAHAQEIVLDLDLTTGVTGIGARDDVMRGSVLETTRFPDTVFTADGSTERFTIPYVQWGTKNPSTLFLRVGNSVDVSVSAVAHIRSGP